MRLTCRSRMETAEMEIPLMESTWMRCFGFPAVLRMDDPTKDKSLLVGAQLMG